MIAVPITAENIDEAIADIKKANEKADVIELRLDFLREVNESVLRELLDECKKPAIVTFRQKNYGIAVETTERMFMLKKAIDFNAHFIDLDFETDRGFVQDLAAKKKNTRIILSLHNFDETPPLPELQKKFSAMLSTQAADVIKIVTFARAEQDNDTMLALVHLAKTSGKPIIAFCTGPKGIKSRIESIKMGAFLTFASLGKGKESASGQPSIEEMRLAMK